MTPDSPRIYIRADAGLLIGTGHVMRCLTLAQALANKGAQCTFLCRPHEGHLIDLVRQRGHAVLALPRLPDAPFTAAEAYPPHASWLGTDWTQDAADCLAVLQDQPRADWLIVDHYALDKRWAKALSLKYKRLLVIDDLADRPHMGDLLLDSCLGRQAEDYTGLVPAEMRLCLGTQYALLRPEFAQQRPYSLARRTNPVLNRILVTLGGVDRTNITEQVLEALSAANLPQCTHIQVVMGPHAPWLQAIRAKAADMPYPTEVLVGVRNMAQLMAEADLAIGAAGGTTWERCCMGLPTLTLVLADNQREIAQKLEAMGAAIALETPQAITAFFLAHTETDKIVDFLKASSQNAAALTDGHGTPAILHAMEGLDA